MINNMEINKYNKSFFKTASFGKSIEHTIIAQMLKEGLDVYLPIIDDKGIDCIIRRSDNSFAEIQIKSHSSDVYPKNAGLYSGIECMLRRNYWYIFWSDGIGDNGTMWIMNSFEFLYYAIRNKRGKNIGKYSIQLSGAKKDESGNLYIYPRKDMEKFISKNFSRIIDNYLLIDNHVDYNSITCIRTNPWDIFKGQHLLYDPSDNKIIVSVSKIEYGNKIWLKIWDLDYIADINMGCIPCGTHESIILKDVKMKWHSEINQWHIWTSSKPNLVYKFSSIFKDDEKYKRWSKIKDYIPSSEELQQSTDNFYIIK